MTTLSTAPSATAGQTRHLLGTLLTFRGTAAQTGQRFSLVECAAAPGAGAPPHSHRVDDEAFYVLEGEFAFMIGDKTETVGPGSFRFVPAGTAHAFTNTTSRPARMLIINLPGGPHEQFFMEAGDPVADASAFPVPAAPDIPRLMKAAERAGIDMLTR